MEDSSADRGQHDSGSGQQSQATKKRALHQTVERAASAYFATCRKLARTINRLKGND